MNSNKNQAITIISSINTQLQLIQKEVLGEENSEQLTHTIPFEILPVTNLHTTDIEEVIFADYDNGSLIRMFDVNTGECIHEDSWKPKANDHFRGFYSGSPFVLIPRVEKRILRGYTISNNSSCVALTNHTGVVKDAVSIRGEKIIVTCGSEGGAYLYSCSDWNCIGSFEASPFNSANAITEIPFMKYLAIGYDDGSINIFHIYTKQLIRHIQISSDPIISISATTDYICAATPSAIYIYRVTGEFIRKINTGHQITVIRCALGDILGQSSTELTASEISDPFSTELMFAGTGKGKVLVFNIINGEQIYTIEGHNDFITSIMISPKKYIFTSSVDGAIRRFHYPTKKCINIYYKYDGVRSFSISKDKKYFCISGITDCKAKLVDVETGTIKKVFSHQDSIRCTAFTTVGRNSYLLTGGWDRKVMQWNYATGELRRIYDVIGRVSDFAIINNTLIVGYYDRDKMGGIQLINLATGKIIYARDAHFPSQRFGRVVVLLVIDKFLYSGGDDGTINCWDLESKNITKSFSCDSGIRSLASSSDGLYLFAGLENSSTVMFEISSGKLKYFFADDFCCIYSLLVINNSLFTADDSGTITKYNLTNYMIEWETKLHDNRIWELKQLGSGEILVSVSQDGTVNFVSISNGELLGTYYNISDGFLWTIPKTDTVSNGYFWTDRLDLVKVFLDTSDRLKNVPPPGSEKVEEYLSVYNNQKIVMSRIKDSKYFQIYQMSSIQINQQQALNKIIECSKTKLLK